MNVFGLVVVNMVPKVLKSISKHASRNGKSLKSNYLKKSADHAHNHLKTLKL